MTIPLTSHRAISIFDGPRAGMMRTPRHAVVAPTVKRASALPAPTPAAKLLPPQAAPATLPPPPPGSVPVYVVLPRTQTPGWPPPAPTAPTIPAAEWPPAPPRITIDMLPPSPARRSTLSRLWRRITRKDRNRAIVLSHA